jgi:hypothetical protein
MPSITIIPSGVLDGKYDWNPSHEQWRRSKVYFVDPTRSVKDESRYDKHLALKEFEEV